MLYRNMLHINQVAISSDSLSNMFASHGLTREYALRYLKYIHIYTYIACGLNNSSVFGVASYNTLL